MNKVTKTAIAGLLALFAGNAAATDGEIVFDGEILKSACEINAHHCPAVCARLPTAA